MSRITYTIPIVLAVTLTVLGGAVAGVLTNRWGASEHLIAAGQCVERLSGSFGDWELVSSDPVEADVQKMLDAAGSTVRVYTNRKTGQVAGVAVIAGPPGPISVHTPEICFSSRDYSQTSARELHAIELPKLGEQKFWHVVFQRNNVRADTLHVSYGWNAGGGWEAPSQPRFSYGRYPVLYKIQVACSVAESETNGAGVNPCQQFLRDFVPVIDRELVFRASSTQPSS